MRHIRTSSTHLRLGRSLHPLDAINSVLNHERSTTLPPTRRLVERDPSSSTSSAATSTETCSNTKDGNTCEKPANTSATLPIALGVVIPILAATIVLLILHRRNKKRMRAQDIKDAEKYKSMDFGMDINFADGDRKKRKKGGLPGQQMSMNKTTGLHNRGLSIDALSAGPYLMGAGKDYAASLHSLSRMTDDVHNPYRQADALSIRAPTPSLRGHGDSDSMRTTNSTIHRPGSTRPDSSVQNLLNHSSPMAKSLPPRSETSPYLPPHSADDKLFEANSNAVISKPLPVMSTLALPHLETARRSVGEKDKKMRDSNSYLRNFIHSRDNSGSDDKEKLATSPPKVDSGFSTSVNSPISQTMALETPPQFPIAELEVPQVITTRPAENHIPALPSFGSSPPFEVAQLHPFLSDANTPDSQSRQDSRDLHKFDFTQGLDSTQNGGFVFHNNHMSITSEYGEHSQIRESTNPYQSSTPRDQTVAALPAMPEIQEDFSTDYYENNHGQDTLMPEHDNRRLSIMMRPLPPQQNPDDPDETPEARANRIRSFYKEYFDNRNTTFEPPVPQNLGNYQLQAGDYYEDYDQEYMNAATVMDQQRGFVVAAPYAQPVTRRAMTPPPRAPPRFRPGPPGGRSGPSSSNGGSRPGSRANGYGGPPSQYSSRSRTQSAAGQYRYDMPPRGQSAMSQTRGRTPHRKPQQQLPPPTTLTSLPTPHMLRDDAVFGATIDFAPPASFRDLQTGRRPDSPLGTRRPYSPSVRSFNPLASSFDDLNVMPSPHSLRKSSTFTGLDFAPPRRIKDNGDNASDNGSIRSGRSGRSGISGVHAYNVRNGAYRVSKIPKELAGTKDEIRKALKPSWDLR